MPDDFFGSGGGGPSLDPPPDSGATLNPMHGAGTSVSILPASSHIVNACNKYDGTPALPIFVADNIVIQTDNLVAAYPSCTLTVQYSANGIRWTDITTITTATTTRLYSASSAPTGNRFARVIVTTAASGSEQLIQITVTALKTGT